MTEIKTQVQAAVMARGGRQHGNEIRFRCPRHRLLAVAQEKVTRER